MAQTVENAEAVVVTAPKEKVVTPVTVKDVENIVSKILGQPSIKKLQVNCETRYASLIGEHLFEAKVALTDYPELKDKNILWVRSSSMESTYKVNDIANLWIHILGDDLTDGKIISEVYYTDDFVDSTF